MGIFRNISVSGLPAQHPRMFVVAILGLEVGAHTVKVRLLRPDGQQAMPNPPEISVHAVAGQDVNVIVELNNMSFTSYGTHKFDLEVRSEEHTSELQSQSNLVCRLLLEKKKKQIYHSMTIINQPSTLCELLICTSVHSNRDSTHLNSPTLYINNPLISYH